MEERQPEGGDRQHRRRERGDTVWPALKPRYAFAAPSRAATTTPSTTALSVSSARFSSGATYGFVSSGIRSPGCAAERTF
jgi:hypothetical protein